MSETAEVVLEEEVADPLAIVGLPTLGLVGTITAQYLVDQLEMPEVGGVYSRGFPPVGRISGGRSGFPVRLHAVEARCGLDLTCEHLVVGVSEFLPGPASVYDLSQALTAWADGADASALVVPDGLLVPGEEREEIHGVAALEGGIGTLEAAGVDPLEEGILGGFSAAVIADGRRRGMNAISLLAESSPEHPDARAAARLVKVLDRLVPDIPIETKPLLEEAKRIEAKTQALREQIDEQTNPTPSRYDSMYQ